jgi:hypothetical protein
MRAIIFAALVVCAKEVAVPALTTGTTPADAIVPAAMLNA